MNKAGAGVAHAVTKFFKRPGRCIVFAGKGHNAGDALFAAQCSELSGWKTECASLSMKRIAVSHAQEAEPFAEQKCTERPSGVAARSTTLGSLFWSSFVRS